MKNILSILLLLTAVLFARCSLKKNDEVRFSEIERGFRNIPDSIQTSVYWYWISDNISKEGVVKDLHAMKKAGINRAFIGNIGLADIPYGKVKMLSDDWWRILHTAMKTATELGIEIGVFNSPGWSQSGGPWVSSSEAMRYLSSSETVLIGPGKVSVRLDKPAEIFQDVRVIAWPSIPTDTFKGRVSTIPRVETTSNVNDGDLDSFISLPDSGSLTVDFVTNVTFPARSLTVYPAHKPLLAEAIFQVPDGNGKFTDLVRFEINRTNAALNTGFDPYAPVTMSIPCTLSGSFRLVIRNKRKGGGIAEIEIASVPKVERYSEKTLAKMHPTPLPYWHDYQWRVQPETDDTLLTIDPGKVKDITEFMAPDGTLSWDVPPGEWVVMRSGMTPTGTVNSPASPEATGYEVDKMSKKHTQNHFEGHMGEILKRIPEEDRKCFRVVVQDSYETGGQNFTDDFIESFKKEFGYDPVPWFPVYNGKVVESRLSSDRFLWDMRRMVADRVAYDYVGGLREISHKYGLRTWLENYGHWGFPGEFLMYGGQSDEVGGEFWSEGDLGNIENRAATSAAHIYGKRKISAESNTCSGRPFSRYPAVIKQRGDRFFAEGINNTLLHVYITQPYDELDPGMNAWFGNEFNRKNTWFSQMDTYTGYLKRTNFMLQQGLNVADVAYFIGEDAPKMTGVTDPPLPAGYQFDYINAEVIMKNMTVKDGLLTLPHGTQYRMLVIPKLETMRPELLAHIRDLVMAGGVIMGPPPLRSPSLEDQPASDKMVKEIAAELWDGIDGIKNKSAKKGKGLVINGLSTGEALDLINCIPDCRLPSDNSVHYGHRTLAGGEIYFLTNQTGETREVTPEFRVKGLKPELWEPAAGYIRNLPAFEQMGEATSVPLKLEPYESVFVVFREKGNSTTGGMQANYPAPITKAEIAGPWTVSFDTAMRGPAQPVTFEKLIDWKDSPDENIKYYSGKAVYTTLFDFKTGDGGTVMIDLGNLTAMARVFINGENAGGAWTQPYRIDISEFVKDGKNELRIEVVNTWVNRLIGDSRLPAGSRKTWCPVNPYTPGTPLQASGLFGPVRILEYAYHKK